MKATTRLVEGRLREALGTAFPVWQQLFDALSKEFHPVSHEWKPTKLEFGGVCLLKQKERTLVYLLPGKLQFEVSVVLGDRAAALALASDLRAETKKLISEARVYAEGRGVRFFIRTRKDIESVVQLVRFKTAPK
jgi:hypothetical protein